MSGLALCVQLKRKMLAQHTHANTFQQIVMLLLHDLKVLSVFTTCEKHLPLLLQRSITM